MNRKGSFSMVRCQTPSIFSFVFGVDTGKVQLVGDLSHKPCQMILRQPVL